MKPTKNRVYCRDCGRVKMLFETEKQADTFIRFNREEIEERAGYCPARSYFCYICAIIIICTTIIFDVSEYTE